MDSFSSIFCHYLSKWTDEHFLVVQGRCFESPTSYVGEKPLHASVKIHLWDFRKAYAPERANRSRSRQKHTACVFAYRTFFFNGHGKYIVKCSCDRFAPPSFVEHPSTDERLRERLRQTNPPQTPASVFIVLSDASRGRERTEGRGWYRQAQQALIMGGNEVNRFLEKELRSVARGGTGSGLEQGGGGEEKEDEKKDTPPEVYRSPQQLRFAAHLALVLKAQCPYLTIVDETMAAVHDAVRRYTEHLAKTQQVGDPLGERDMGRCMLFVAMNSNVRGRISPLT